MGKALSKITEPLPPRRTTWSEKVDEIKKGGCNGCFGVDQADWGENHGGKIWEVWKLEPCCGEPCNAKDASYCFSLWSCCNLCTFGKLYSHSVEQPCALIPHIAFSYCCPFCACAFMRYSLRAKFRLSGNLLGDCMCILGCGPCAVCQALRASQKKDWDIFPCDFVPIAPKPKDIIL